MKNIVCHRWKEERSKIYQKLPNPIDNNKFKCYDVKKIKRSIQNETELTFKTLYVHVL